MQSFRPVVLLLPLAVACSDSSPSPNNADGGPAAKDGSASDSSAAKPYVPPPTCSSTDPGTSRTACSFKSGATPEQTLGSCATPTQIPIENIVLLMQENRSFDHYFGKLPGNGQDDVDVPDAGASNPVDPSDPSKGTVPWHHMSEYCFSDTNHEWEGSHVQWGRGAMNGFPITNVRADDPTGARSMGYLDKGDLPFYYALASTFTISDRYFSDLLGPTWPNRMYFYGGSSFGRVENILPPGSKRTIFHQLDEKGITWKVYRKDTPGMGVYFDLILDPKVRERIVPVAEFLVDAANGALPQVAYVDGSMSLGSAQPANNGEHPPGNAQYGQAFVREVILALMNSVHWKSSALFLTYDEHGGLYDHVAPPAACPPDDIPPDLHADLGGFDRYGVRVPLILVSPFAKKHHVSHVVHSHASILRFVQTRFGLPALTARDANSSAMLDMFDFQNPPFMTPPTLPDAVVDEKKAADCIAKFPN